MNRINRIIEKAIPIKPGICYEKRVYFQYMRELRKQRLLEQMRLLFESGYHEYVNKEACHQ